MSAVADDLIRRLREAGTRALFGLPGGGGNLDLIDAAGRTDLPFVLTATETGSAIAAIAQAEITGAPGACLTTIGPGATSIVNGVACAHLDRAPLLVVTDRYPASAASFEHQRIDHHALMAPITKWSATLAPDRAGEVLDRAFRLLAAAPLGPVHLDYTEHAEGTEDTEKGTEGTEKGTEGTENRRQRALARRIPDGLVTSSRRPLLIAGLGARRPEIAAAVRAICERHGIPALVTYKAKGVVPDDHRWFAGLFTHAALERGIIDQSDLLIGVGFDPVEILPRPWRYAQPVVSIASHPLPDDHVPFVAQDAGDIVSSLAMVGERLKSTAWDQPVVRAHADAARRAIDLPAAGMTAQAVVRAAAAVASGRARVTVDAGAHMFAATILWPVSEPNELLISNGLSTMGFALPAAIGAGAVDRSRPVVALTGDGGLLICLGELQTAVRERLKIVTVVFNDASLSLIEIKQQQRRLSPAGVALGDIHWPRIAEGFGLPAWRAATPDEVERAVAAALRVEGPSLIEARIDRSNYAETMRAIRG